MGLGAFWKERLDHPDRVLSQFLNSVTAEDTRSQAPADVTEGGREAGSPAKSAGSQGCSSAGGKLLDPSDANISTLSAKGTGSQARDSWAAEKSENSSEDDNDTHRRGVKQVRADLEMVGEAYRQGFIHYHAGEIAEHMEQMAIGPDASEYGPSDDEGEAYRQDFIHYHVGEIAEHMQQMAIGPETSDYRPSDDENQRSVRSRGTAMCNHVEGQGSDENNASQQHSEYSSADDCGRSERSIESCSSDSSGRSERNIESCSSDDNMDGDGEAAEAVDV